MMQRKYETVVGIFVVASLAALLVMVIIIAQQERLWEKHVEYEAIFKDISGLKEGSEVRLAGVTVGNVTGIAINPEGRIIVSFQVVGKYENQIRKDSRATIGFQGLLGEKSLDISAGTPNQPEIPPGGRVTSIEPFNITELIAKATPTFENVQKVLKNLNVLTGAMTKPGGEFNKSMAQIGQIITKVNKGKGTVGQFLNNPALYRDAAQAMLNIRNFAARLEQDKGALGTLLNDPAFKEDLRKTMTNIEKASSRLPGLMKKAEAFVDQLQKAGKGLPGLVTSGESMVGNVDKAAKAAQKSWLLRRNVPKAKERTLTVE